MAMRAGFRVLIGRNLRYAVKLEPTVTFGMFQRLSPMDGVNGVTGDIGVNRARGGKDLRLAAGNRGTFPRLA